MWTRLLIALAAVVILGVAAVGSGMFGRVFPDEAAQRAAAERRMAEIGIRARLDQDLSEPVRVFVLGRPIDAEQWDFRGEALKSGQAQPVYGVAARSCPALEAAEPTCWNVLSLIVDGQETARETAQGPARQPAQETTRETAQETTREASQEPALATSAAGRVETASEGAAAPGSGAEASIAAADGLSTAAVAAAAEPSAAAPPPAAIETALGDAAAATHQVAGSEVNLRAGPGREFESLGVATRGQRLVLLERRDGWARFRLIDGPEPGAEAWLFEALTAPVS